MTVWLPASLHDRIATKADQEQQSVSKIVRDVLSQQFPTVK